MQEPKQVARLHEIADEASGAIGKALARDLSSAEAERVSTIVEDAVMKAMLEGLQQAIHTCRHVPGADEDQAHKIAEEIRLRNVSLIANLSALR